MVPNQESLESLQSSVQSRQVTTASSFVKLERYWKEALQPKFIAREHICKSCSEWIGKSDGMNATEWGWNAQGGKLVPPIMYMNPAPDKLLKMIHCNYTAGCVTKKCTCRRNGLECTIAFGHFVKIWSMSQSQNMTKLISRVK